MKSTPLVSICIPTYLGAKTIGATIESVLNQDFGDFELVVVDDGSPDETAAIVARFSDPRLRYERNERNLGPLGNWNRCLDLASGKYFKLLPHDDLLAPACLSEQVKVLENDTEEKIALVFCAREVIGPDGRILARRGYRSAPSGVINGKELARRCVRAGTNLIGEPGAILCRRALASVIGGYDAANPYVIDLDYSFRLLAHGDAYYLSDSLASFRVSDQQWSVKLGDSQSSDFNAFVARIGPAIGMKWTFGDKLASRAASRMNNWMRLAFYLVFLRMLPVLRRYTSLRYVLVGIVNTGFSYAIYALLIFLGAPIPWASLGALLAGIVWSFGTHGSIVFNNLSKPAFLKFVLNWAVIYVLNVELIYKLMQLKMNAYTAAAVATIPVTIISYFSMKYLVFKESK